MREKDKLCYIYEKVESDASIDPPIHAEYFSFAGAITFASIFDGMTH
jgi:hypothetical protein